MTVATPVDFAAYGDYAPPPGAYVQQGNMATLVYRYFDHIARGTFGTGAGIRTHRIVPATPEADWDAPHDRG